MAWNPHKETLYRYFENLPDSPVADVNECVWARCPVCGETRALLLEWVTVPGVSCGELFIWCMFGCAVSQIVEAARQGLVRRGRTMPTRDEWRRLVDGTT